ncbi:hypothetical protein N2152v2_009227 [Parachlorella kessleri]
MKALRKLTTKLGSEAQSPKSAILVVDGETFDDAQEALLHRDAHEEGGLGFTDKELLERQRGAVVEVVKQLGSNLLTGNFDLLKMSLPVKLFEPRSYLQKLADPWVYPRFLQLAAQADDPGERMRWVVTWFIAGLHHAFERWAKPFNPILGETWQAGLPDGSQIFLEQISHHPPISAFELCGPNNMYMFSGLSQPAVSYKTNAVKTTAKGYRAISFPDGSKISIQYPAYYLKGLLYTNMPRADIVGEAEFDDVTNGLHATVRFGKVEGSSSMVLNRSDAFCGTLYEDISRAVANTMLEPSKNSVRASGRVSRNSGSALSSIVPKSLTMRSARYWTLGDEAPQHWVPVANPLPSDCRFREDLVLLQQGDVKQGQVAKERLENLQRTDAKLRKAGNAE